MDEDTIKEEVREKLKEIDAEYSDKTIWRRLGILFSGISKPRSSKEYKEAMIELQRLGAPAAAIMIPVVMIGLLVIMSAGQKTKDRVIETQIMEATDVKELEQEEEPLDKPPEIDNDVQVDVPVDSVNVRVDTPTTSANVSKFSAQPQAFDSVMAIKSPVIMRNVYGSTRNTGSRGKSLRAYGGDAKTEGAVIRSLRWLKQHQGGDGSWGGSRVAMTGLAVLTFLAHGEKPGAESPEFGQTVQKALEYLLRAQDPKTGTFNPHDGNNYSHLIATYALSEAFGMTGNPNVKAAAEKSLVAIIKGQHPTGGWTYNMNPNPEKDGKYRDDTSYMGWAVQALKAAKLANIHVEGMDRTYKMAVRGFKKNAHPKGGFGYTSPAQGGLTSVGVLCMMFLGAGNDKDVRNSLDLMDSWEPTFSKYEDLEPELKNVGKLKKDETALSAAKGKMAAKVPEAERKFYTSNAQYYYYYATQCRFHAGGARWDKWNKAMKPAYVAAQEVTPASASKYVDAKGQPQAVGYWRNVDNLTDRPVMDTCLAALQLMVYYRYLPTTKQSAVQVVQELGDTQSTDTDDIKVDSGNL